MDAKPPAPSTPKKGLSGFVIVLFFIGGLFAVACIAGSVMLYGAVQSPQGKKMLNVVGKGVALAARGMNAPGTAELRKAGCEHALVLDVAEVLEELPEIIDAGPQTQTRELGLMVVCQGSLFATLPECDALAVVYAKAVHPTDPFFVMATAKGHTKPQCQRRYRSDGTGGKDIERRAK